MDELNLSRYFLRLKHLVKPPSQQIACMYIPSCTYHGLTVNILLLLAQTVQSLCMCSVRYTITTTVNISVEGARVWGTV